MVAQCADTMAQAGATVSQVRPPMIAEAHEIYVHLLSADGGVGLGELLKSWGTAEAHPYTKRAQAAQHQHRLSAGEFGGWLYRLDQFRQRMSVFMADYDAIICPVAPCRPWRMAIQCQILLMPVLTRCLVISCRLI